MAARLRALLCASVIVEALACTPREHVESLGRGGGPKASEPSRAGMQEPRAPLTADEPLVELKVPGFASAIVAPPIGATVRKPILVAAHGRSDRAEPLCEMWRTRLEARAFVLCPRGLATESGLFTYDSASGLAEEVHAGVAAVRARWPDHADAGPLVYAGFSLGAFYGVEVAARDPARVPRVLLIEGGHDPWDDRTVERFAKHGGERVLFLTGQQTNRERAAVAAEELTAAGVATKIGHAEGAGHVYTGAVGEQLTAHFDWLVEGDPRWAR